MGMIRLIQQPVGYPTVVGQPRRQPPVAGRPRLARLALEQQARGDARLAPVWVHQAIQFFAEIQRLHSRPNTYTPTGAARQRSNKGGKEWLRFEFKPQSLF